MARFKDNKDREWNLSLCAPTIREVRKACEGFDLADVEGKTFERLANDPVLLVDTLWVLCRGQHPSVTDEDFGRSLTGDTIEAAVVALWEAVVDFFPSRTRALLTATAHGYQQRKAIALDRALAKIQDPTSQTRILSALETRLDREIQAILSNGAIDSPEPVASVPTG